MGSGKKGYRRDYRFQKQREQRGTDTPATAVVAAAVSGWCSHLKRRCVRLNILLQEDSV